jgi:hypothetical protein
LLFAFAPNKQHPNRGIIPSERAFLSAVIVCRHFMDDKSSIAFGPLTKAMYYAKFCDVISKINDSRIRAQTSGELVDVLLHLVDMRVAVLRLVSFEIVQKHKTGTLIFVETAAYSLLR